MRYNKSMDILLILLLLALYGTFDACWMAIKEREFLFEKPKFTRRTRILLLSDLHVGRWSKFTRLWPKLAKLKRINENRPFDAILVAGDFMDKDAKYYPLLKEVAEYLVSFGVPVIAVIGNHDALMYELKAVRTVSILEKVGIKVLRNQTVPLSKMGQKILITGIDELQLSPVYGNGLSRRKCVKPGEYIKRVQKMDWYTKATEFTKKDEGLRIMLAHNPDAVYLNGAEQSDLVLAGHTHGGQFWPMDWLYPVLYSWHFYRNSMPAGSFGAAKGLYMANNTNLLISGGLGSASLPFRLFHITEANIIDLVPKSLL